MKLTLIVIIFIVGLLNADVVGISNPNQIKAYMKQIVTREDILRLSDIVSPYYGLAVNRVEYIVSTNTTFSPKFKYVLQITNDYSDKRNAWYMRRVVLSQREFRAIANKFMNHSPTSDYSDEELAVLDIVLPMIGGNGSYLFNSPNYEKDRKNTYFYEDTKPQLLKQKQIIIGQKNVTVDPKEEYYEFGYGRLHVGGAMSFHFHTDKTGHLWLWAIQ